METTAKALPKFEVPTGNSNLAKHRHQQTENILNERGIKYELKFLPHQIIKGAETYQIRTVEKSAAGVGNSAHLCQKILADLKEAEALNCIFPSIVVIRTIGKDYVIIDGRHRFAVLSAKGKEIPAYIVDSSLPEGDCFALATVFNDNHGTPNDLIFRKKHATQQAINYINTQVQSVTARGDLTRLLKEAAGMFQLSYDSLSVNFEIDESERLMRRAGASENAIENIGSVLKRGIRMRLKTGEQESNLKLINEIASCGLDQKSVQEMIKKFKESSNLELSQEIRKSSAFREDGKVKSAGEISRDQTADRFVQTINGALGLLEGRKPQSLRLSVDQKSDVRKDLAAIAKEATRWSRLFEEELDA